MKPPFQDSKHLIGELFVDYPVRKTQNIPTKKKVASFIMPAYIYAGNIYPPHFTGGLYILPFKTLECLFATALKTPHVPINDQDE